MLLASGEEPALVNETARHHSPRGDGGMTVALQSVDLNCDMGEGFGHWTYGDAPDDER
jgi:hypothetical protein